MITSIQQAAGNALIAYLTPLMPDVVFRSSWPSSDKGLPPKAITLVTAGARRDTPLDRNLLSSVKNGTHQADSVWSIAACTQPFQLDVWAHSNIERDDMLARLDTHLHAGERGLGAGNWDPFGHGVLLYIRDGWDAFGTTADFDFQEPDTDDSGDNAQRDVWRATYRGDSNFMLALNATTARIVSTNFSQYLDGASTPGL